MQIGVAGVLSWYLDGTMKTFGGTWKAFEGTWKAFYNTWKAI